MSPETAADKQTRAHEQSSRALCDLLQHAAEAVCAHARFDAIRRVGPLPCRIVANDSEAGDLLTRCMLPAERSLSGEPHLEIFVLCGSSPPHHVPPAWNFAHTDARHLERLHLSSDKRISAFYDADRRFWFIVDKSSRQALFWIADAADIPFWEEAAPFKLPLHWFLSDSSLTMVHGGVVCDSRSALLLVGPGGSGKSTTVAACLQAGLGVCGDDLVLTERVPSGWIAHALYDSVKLAPDGGIAVPPLLAAAPSRPCGAKRLVRYSDAAPAQFASSSPLCAIAQCVVTGSESTTLEPMSPAAMLRALAPPTVFLLRGREAETLRKIGELVRTLPCLRLRLGRNPAEAASVLGSWLAGRPA